MNDSTFLRNLARRGRVVLLADGTALPAPTSVMDDDSQPGSTFYIKLISPEGVESGDRRQFEPGTITWRELPIPLMWQWQLEDGHNSAVIVGRIDYIEQTDDGLGNARGVFDSGPWGREAERLVRAEMLRGVSGDYSNFTAEITDPADESSGQIKDNAINVTGSKLVSATLVAKPAFEGCYITVDDPDDDSDDTPVDDPDDADYKGDPDDYVYDDGVIEANVPITASALIASGMQDMVARLERLELMEYELEIGKWQLTASAARERVESHRLQIEAERARARVAAARNMTAAWRPFDKGFLSRKAKLQPRDKRGRWIEMGALVRWLDGKQIGGKKGYKHGKVQSFNASDGRYTVKDSDGSIANLKGSDLEVVKAMIPDTPDDAKKFEADATPSVKTPGAPSAPSDDFTKSVNDFESAMKGAGFDPADTDIADHVDELKNNPETRDANQVGAIEDWVNEHRDEMTDADAGKVDAALDGIKKSMDSTASDLTVPDDFGSPAPKEPSPAVDPLDQLAKDFENSPEGQRAKNLQRLEQFLQNAESGEDPQPVEPLQIKDTDGDMTRTFHDLGLDDEDNNIRADEGESIRSFEQRVMSGDKPSDQEWTDMNNDVTLYKDELSPGDYEKLKTAWDGVKQKGGATSLGDSPDWKNDSRRLTDPAQEPAAAPALNPSKIYTPNPAGDFTADDRVTWTDPDGTKRSGKVTGGLLDGSSITVLPDDSDTTLAKAPADLAKGKSLDDELHDLTKPGNTDDDKKGE